MVDANILLMTVWFNQTSGPWRFEANIENTVHTGDVSDEGSKRASVYNTFGTCFYPTICLESNYDSMVHYAGTKTSATSLETGNKQQQITSAGSAGECELETRLRILTIVILLDLSYSAQLR